MLTNPLVSYNLGGQVPQVQPSGNVPISGFQNFREVLSKVLHHLIILVVVVGLGVYDLVQAGLQLDGDAVHDVGRHHRPAGTQ